MVYRTDVKHISHFLHEVDIFKGLSERHLDRIAALCEERQFNAGDILGVQNERGRNLYLIREGEVTVTTGSQEMSLVVRTVGKGEALHLASIFEPPILVTTTRAATGGVAYAIPRVQMLELCEVEPRIGLHIYRAACDIVVDRYRYALNRISEPREPTTQINPSREGAEV